MTDILVILTVCAAAVAVAGGAVTVRYAFRAERAEQQTRKLRTDAHRWAIVACDAEARATVRAALATGARRPVDNTITFQAGTSPEETAAQLRRQQNTAAKAASRPAFRTAEDLEAITMRPNPFLPDLGSAPAPAADPGPSSCSPASTDTGSFGGCDAGGSL